MGPLERVETGRREQRESEGISDGEGEGMSHHASIHGRRSSSCVQALHGWRCSSQ